MPVVAGCRDAAKHKSVRMELRVLPSLCRQYLRSIRTNDEIILNKLYDTSVISEDDDTSFRHMEHFVFTIRVANYRSLTLIDNGVRTSFLILLCLNW